MAFILQSCFLTTHTHTHTQIQRIYIYIYNIYTYIYTIFYIYCIEDLSTVFIVIFIHDFCIVKNFSYVWRFEFVSVFIMLCYYMMFYGTYVGKVVGKATRERGCYKTHNFPNNKQFNTTPNMTSEMVEGTWANIGVFLHNLNPEMRRIVRRLERLQLKIIKKRQSLYISFSPSLSLSLYIYIYICVCVCVCVNICFHLFHIIIFFLYLFRMCL